VHVRVLVDDWGTLEKNDAAVALVDAHPHIEIRVFNPHVNRSGILRVRESLTSLARVNRRMHNKQLIADGQAVVLGGRNIGDEYFELGELRFHDIDVLGVGPVAAESATSFEAYWNSEFAIPMSQVGTYVTSGPAIASQRQALRERVEAMRDSAYVRALAESDLAKALRAHDLELRWADGKVLSDPPAKLRKPAGTPSKTYLGEQLTPYAQAVRSELLVVSAYFVPGRRGVELFGGMSDDGVSVRILTNSLAGTDAWLVHAAYRKYRRALLQRGVAIFELKPGAREAAGLKRGVGSSRASLHAKTFVFDRSSVFIGSVNIDPRSLAQNTEVGVLVQSRELAREVAELVERWSGPDFSYALALSSNTTGSRLHWVGMDDGKRVEFTGEPHAGLGRRLGARVFSRLPIESLV
jgi:putative cardiolipin synthase